MIKGEYRGASLGTLAVILGAVGVWAVIETTGGDGDDEAAPAGPVITHADDTFDGGPSAIVAGEIEINGTCLHLVDGGVRHAVVWPFGTTWDAQTATIGLPNGDVVAIGDSVSGGGGYFDSVGHYAGGRAHDAASACRTDEGQIAVFNNHPDEVERVESAESPAPTTTEVALPPGGLDGVVIRHAPPFDTGSDGAEIAGTIILERGCLLVAAAYGSFPIVWPAGTTWDAEAAAVVLASGERIAIGDGIRGAGGYGSADGMATFGSDAAEAASRCAEGEYREVAMLGNDPDVVEGLGPAPVDGGHVATDGPVIRYPPPLGGDGTSAEVGGVLVLRGDCLQFEYGPDAEAGYLPIIWPAGTTWDADSQQVVLPTGLRADIGATLDGGGGYPYADRLASLGEDAQALAEACADNEWGEVAAFNNFLDAIEIVEPAGG
ncbi:MAG: hypothetical protein AAGA90_10310 [Actinomycetota bacterium]